VEIAATGQVGIHCSQTTQRERKNLRRKLSGSRVKASVGQTPVPDNISGDVKILRQSIGNGHMDGFFGKSESNSFFHEDRIG